MQPLYINIIQTDLAWENKKTNLENLEAKIKAIPELKGIVILPEMFSTGFSMNAKELGETMGGDSVKWMKAIAAKYKIILTGSLIISEQGKFYNRLIWMMPDGHFGCYDKRHLFAFGKEDEHFAPGNKRLLASVNGWKINLQVCYDLRFPVWARQGSNNGNAEFDLLIYTANWPEKRSHAWTTLLTARAIENQCYVIGVNRVGVDGNGNYYNGNSMLIDPLGEILYQKKDAEDIFTSVLSGDHLNEVRNKFPFLKDKDAFTIRQ